ncbi:hypothetical protein D3C86_1981410 [compost metagenome]
MLIWSISLASSASKSALVFIIPSITIKGEPKVPLILISDVVPAKPEVLVTVTPAALPAKALERFVTGTLFTLFMFMEETAPVMFAFFCVP